MEQRLERVEDKLTHLEQLVSGEAGTSKAPWYEAIHGVFEDCPEFDEAMRLGREWRASQTYELERGFSVKS